MDDATRETCPNPRAGPEQAKAFYDRLSHRNAHTRNADAAREAAAQEKAATPAAEVAEDVTADDGGE